MVSMNAISMYEPIGLVATLIRLGTQALVKFGIGPGGFEKTNGESDSKPKMKTNTRVNLNLFCILYQL